MLKPGLVRNCTEWKRNGARDVMNNMGKVQYEILMILGKGSNEKVRQVRNEIAMIY